MVFEYRIEIKNNAGSTLNFGNVSPNLILASKIKNVKKDKIATLTFDIVNSSGTYTNEFTELNEVNLYIDHDLGGGEFHRFDGEVVEQIPSEDGSIISVICKGSNRYLKERVLNEVATNIDFGQWVKDRLTAQMPEVNATGITTSTGYIIDEIRADAQYMFDNFEDLEKETTWKLDIVPGKVAELFDGDRGASGITLTDGTGGNVKQGTIGLRNSNVSRKNSVTVIGGNETIVDFDEDQFTWATGDATVIPLSNAIDTLGFVKFGGVTKTEGTDFEITTDRKSLKLITISNADTVDIRYDFKSQVWWKEQDPSATIIRELTIKDETILTQARAEILARNTLERVNISQTKGNISSEAIVTNFKWYQTLELAVTNFTGTFNIVGYTETIAETYTVNFDLSVVLDQNSQKILDLIKQVDKLASQNFESVTIKDGFFLQDLMAITDYLEGFESGIGTRFYYDISDWDDSKTYDTGETSETQFL